METLLVADGDPQARQEFFELFTPAGFHVITSCSVVDLLSEIRRRSTRVLLLGGELNGLPSVDLIPLLRKCNRKLQIILIADEVPSGAKERLRNEGIVFHGPRPADLFARSRLLQTVRCAFAAEMRERNKGANDAQ